MYCAITQCGKIASDFAEQMCNLGRYRAEAHTNGMEASVTSTHLSFAHVVNALLPRSGSAMERNIHERMFFIVNFMLLHMRFSVVAGLTKPVK